MILISDYLHVIVFILITCFKTSWHINCPAGKFVSGEETCVECPENSYRSEINHQYRRCENCTTRDNHDLQLATPCSSTHNNLYKCVSGKFNSNGDEIVCLSCLGCESLLQFEAETCRHDKDAICCPDKGMTLKARAYNMPCEINSTHGGYCCIKLPTLVSTSIRPIDYSTQDKATSTSPSPAYSPDNNTASIDRQLEYGSGLSDGEIVGIVFGGIVIIVFIVLAIVLICWCYRKERKEHVPVSQTVPMDDLRMQWNSTFS